MLNIVAYEAGVNKPEQYYNFSKFYGIISMCDGQRQGKSQQVVREGGRVLKVTETSAQP